MSAFATSRNWTISVVGLALIASAAASLQAENSLPQLWPRFSEPSTIVNVGLTGQSGDDFMAITSFQGAYNQQQLKTRLYVNTPAADATYWLNHALPRGIKVVNLAYTSSDPDGALKALLSTYGPQGSNTVTKYVVCDPVNLPETCNMATTMAGINDAMVVNPDNLPVVSSYGLTEVADLRTYLWIGSTPGLVNNATMNMISNPSGSNGTSGWTDNGGTVSTGTPTGNCATSGTTLEWTRTSGSGNAWAYYDPAIPSSRINTSPYIFSVQVCVASGSPVFLDAYDGAADVQSGTVAAGAGWQTLQLAVPIPLSGATGNSTIKLQVRTAGSSTQVYFQNAAVVGNRVAIDYYQYTNLFPQTSGMVLAQDNYNNGNLRDYLIAAKVFTFELTDDSAYKDELALYTTILSDSHTQHVTPILGYIDHENEDVTFLSSEAGNGHFLNASDDYNNGSVWASMPQPSHLWQPGPTAIPDGPALGRDRNWQYACAGEHGTSLPGEHLPGWCPTAPATVTPQNGTVYLAFAASDGDNSSIVEHQDVSRWTAGQYFGAVPMAWTMPMGMIDFAPGILTNYYAFLPQSQELMSGPSGVGYTRGITGSDLSTFASYTDQFMQAENMDSVTEWSGATSDLETFASDVNEDNYNVPHVLWNNYLPYTQEGSVKPYTVLDGQGIGYNATPPEQLAAIESFVASHYSSSAPNFVEALDDDLTTPTDDVLFIAQQLQLNGGHPYVFMTPSELAATEYAYNNAETGSAASTHDGHTGHGEADLHAQMIPQSVDGSTLTTAYPQNVLYNANGQEPGAGLTSTGWALGTKGHDESLVSTIYKGSSCELLQVPGNSANPTIYGWEYLGNVPVAGRYYRFTASVAGSGTAQMTIYDGSANNHSATIPLTPSFQTITMILKMNSTSKGQIQVGVLPSGSRQTLYFSASASMLPGWYYGAPSSTGNPVTAGGTTYNNGSFGAQALYLSVPAGQSSAQSLSQFPSDLAGLLAPNTSYTASVDVAGTPGGQAYLSVLNGGVGATSPTVTLGQQWQTLTTTFTTGSSSAPVQWEIGVPSGNSANETVYFRNASLVPTSSMGTIDFYTSLESGQRLLTWTDRVDERGTGYIGVSSPILESSSTITRGGSNAIQYGGTAMGSPMARAYMKAFSDHTKLTATSRLSYWIYPMTPLGSETGASAMTGLNSTCVAVDLVLADGSDLRDATIRDQYGNQLSPSQECNHLEPDQWNYVTADLSGLAGKTVNRIDVGYEQPGGRGSYGGYIDDISLSH